MGGFLKCVKKRPPKNSEFLSLDILKMSKPMNFALLKLLKNVSSFFLVPFFQLPTN